MNHKRAQYVKQDIAKHKQHEKEKTTVCWTMNNKTQTKWTRREQYVEQGSKHELDKREQYENLKGYRWYHSYY